MPFADELIGRSTALALAQAIHAAEPARSLTALHTAQDALGSLTLRQRSDLLRDALLSDINEPYPAFAEIIRQAAAGPAYFSGWLIWPVTTAVAERAILDGSDDAFDDALDLLALLTTRLSSEFAIRALLRCNLPRALGAIHSQWVTSADVDVRRLASEGTRPYLPWSTRVPGLLENPAATIPILDGLYRDDSDYVRRSVANHLNDLSRDHPDLAVATAASWLETPDATTSQVVARGLRTLIKNGNPGALALLGFQSTSLDVSELVVDRRRVAIGEAVTFSCEIINTGDKVARLSIDYRVHHVKAKGHTTAKTFKLAIRTLRPRESTTLTKTHAFRIMSTRKYYSGVHSIELMVNGVSAGRLEFELVVS